MKNKLKRTWAQAKWIWQYARQCLKPMLLYTILGIAGSGVSFVSAYISKNLVDIITGQDEGQKLLSTFISMIAFSMANILFTQASTYASTYINLKVDARIKDDIFTKMLSTDWESLSQYHTGDLVTRWSSDVSNISAGVLNWIPNLIIYTFRFLGALALVVYYDPSFAFFALIGIPFSALLSKPLLSRMRKNNSKSAEMNAKLYGFHQESFSNIQTIKAFDLIGFYTEKLRSLQKDYISMRLDFQKTSMVTSILMNLIGFIVSYSCYGWGIYRVWTGAISYGTMTMFLSLSGTLTTSVNSLVSLIPSAISLTISAERLMDIVGMPQEDYSDRSAVASFEQESCAEGVGVYAKDLGYTYRSGTEVFRDASFYANPHEVVALIGPSGEGKTTMLRLLLALLTPSSGELMLCKGGQKDRQIAICPSTRHLFSYVPQGNTLFSGTIAENMRIIKPNATEEDIIHALKLACAWDFVEKLPEGIHSQILERGGGFSEGQAQRLSIARALLRQSPILLLDEATSALDAKTEKKLLSNIMQDTYPRTCIVTTHRPAVLELCTRIYTINEKQCKEDHHAN